MEHSFDFEWDYAFFTFGERIANQPIGVMIILFIKFILLFTFQQIRYINYGKNDRF